MSISALKKDIENIKHYRSSAFIGEHSDTTNPSRSNVTFRALGEVRDVRVSWSPLTTSRSSTGGSYMYGATLTATFVMMQTSDVEIAALPTIIRENDLGSTFKFTLKPCAAGGASAAEGFLFENCAVTSEGSIDLGGGESGITITFEGDIDTADLALLGTPKSSAAPYADGERVITFGC